MGSLAGGCKSFTFFSWELAECEQHCLSTKFYLMRVLRVNFLQRWEFVKSAQFSNLNSAELPFSTHKVINE